jgi:hypothetical protein
LVVGRQRILIAVASRDVRLAGADVAGTLNSLNQNKILVCTPSPAMADKTFFGKNQAPSIL